ncbi:kinase-like domain-containing protein [Ampelomyces quisqualis]|uniref:non-specific serine/threonine protein kinase n=1 Tax=Ampelomyces quisqualis TaxID=50730 RepID=A0A6A5QPD9_AMPQU|nr:kinase-like domain-containing protein [Ampelomyces quisqualis]
MAAAPDPQLAQLDDYMAKMDMVYELDTAEKELHDSLPDQAAKLRFQHYLIGIKLAHYGEDLPWNEWHPFKLKEHIEMWNARDGPTALAPAYIYRGRNKPDPRLDARNYKLGPALQAHHDTFDPERQRSFHDYAIGRIVATDVENGDPALEQSILHDWYNNAEADRSDMEELGRHWQERFYQLKHPVPHKGTNKGHCYDASNIRPPPTVGDINHVQACAFAPTGTEWKFERTVYQNRHRDHGRLQLRRIIHLFVRIDAFGIIHDRMAVKVQGESNMAEINEYVGREFRIQNSLNQIENPNILVARSWSHRQRPTAPPFLGYIFLDWAPFGSLLDHVREAQARNANPSLRNKQFPEPLLWLIFRGLAETLYVMRTGRTIAPDEPTEAESRLGNGALIPSPGWRPLVNTDIKLGNVVFSHAQKDHYPAYKTTKMIDFGNTGYAGRFRDERSKREATAVPGKYGPFFHIGTPGIRPPEQHQPCPRRFINEAVDSRSDTWNIGLIMFQLMEQDEFYTNKALHTFSHTAEYNESKQYSNRLNDLVMQCLKHSPDDRPQINHLLYHTRIGLQKWQDAHIDVDGNDVAEWLRWGFEEEEFPIGKGVPRHWRWARRRRRDGDDERRRDDDDGDDDDCDDGDDLRDRRWRNGKEVISKQREQIGPENVDHPVERDGQEEHALQWEDFKPGNMERAIGRETDISVKEAVVQRGIRTVTGNNRAELKQGEITQESRKSKRTREKDGREESAKRVRMHSDVIT